MTELERLREINAWLETDEGKAALRDAFSPESFEDALKIYNRVFKREAEPFDGSKCIVSVKLIK